MSEFTRIIKTYLSIFALAISCLVFLYSILGIFQAIDLGVGPGYSKGRLLTNLGVWGLLSIISLCVIFLSFKDVVFFIKKT